jgi:hypothetical protein
LGEGSGTIEDSKPTVVSHHDNQEPTYPGTEQTDFQTANHILLEECETTTLLAGKINFLKEQFLVVESNKTYFLCG